jgi:HK97 family phage prohead protease
MSRRRLCFEDGPHTLADVHAARQGSWLGSVSSPLQRRSFVSPNGDQRAARQGAAGAQLLGHATVYGVTYPVGGGPEAGGFLETVMHRSGSASLASRPDVVLLVNHQGLPLARTVSGTLALTEDHVGLHVAANLDRSDPASAAVLSKTARGDVSEMSFAFRVVVQEWNSDWTERWITCYDIHRGDVSIVTYGANAATQLAA